MKNKIIIIVSTIIILLACAFIAVKFINRESEDITQNNDTEQTEITQDDSSEDEEYNEAVITTEYSDVYKGNVDYMSGKAISLRIDAYITDASEYGFQYGYTDNCIKFILDNTDSDDFEIINSYISSTGLYVYDVVSNDHVYSIVEGSSESNVADQHITKEEALEWIADRGYL